MPETSRTPRMELDFSRALPWTSSARRMWVVILVAVAALSAWLVSWAV